MKYEQKRDLLSAAIFLLLGLIIVFLAIPQGVSVPSSIEVAALSPDFWPRVIAIGAVLSSVFMLVEAYTLQPPSDGDDADEEAEYKLATLPAALRTVVLIVALFVFYASLTTLGVVTASIILLFAMMLFFGERSFLLIAALSFGIPIILYLFFRYVASVPIPVGIFGF